MPVAEEVHFLFPEGKWALDRAKDDPRHQFFKRFGEANEAPLSFPFRGWTFAIDFPISEKLPELLRDLDAIVLEAGGRIYLGKDAFVDADTFRQMYPRLDEWLELKREVDPDGVFDSSLARRVGLRS